MNAKLYTYRVLWSEEDAEFVGLCAEFPSLSWLEGVALSTLPVSCAFGVASKVSMNCVFPWCVPVIVASVESRAGVGGARARVWCK